MNGSTESRAPLKRVTIVGLGNILEGDLGVGCYLLEALSQETLDDCIELSYLGEDALNADACIYGMELSIIVQAIDVGGPPGSVHCWPLDVFRNNVCQLSERYDSMRLLDRALSQAEFAGGLPSELMFLWLQPRCTEGLCLSKEGRKALRSAVGIIKRMLSERGFLPANIPHLARIYHLDVLHTAV